MLGVELIYRDLQVAPSTYCAATYRAPSTRTLGGAVLSWELYSLRENNRKVYEVRKPWKAARRAGITVGRDLTAQLVGSTLYSRCEKLRGLKATKPNPAAVRHPDRGK